MKRLLIVEDQGAIRAHAVKLMRDFLSDLDIVEAANGTDGTNLALSEFFDLIVMDISMPDMSGIKAAQQIWHVIPNQRILFWSQYHREAYVRELGKIVPDDALHGYALKSESDEKLIEAVGNLLLHDIPYIDPVVRGVQQRLLSKTGSLSDVEYETLLDVAIGLTDKAIASRRHISVRGVQNRLSMLLQKLVKGEDAHLRESASMEVYNPRTRIVFECLKRGLIDPDELPSLEKELFDWLSDEFDYERA